MAKILFVNASKKWEGRTYREYPYGIGILATLAKQQGHDIHILDMAVDSRGYLDILNNNRFDIVAITFMSPSLGVAMETIKTIRENFSGDIVAGGIHSTLYPSSIISYGADVVVVGEGEPIFLLVVDALKYGKNSARDVALARIPNVVYRDNFNEIQQTARNAESVILDELPIMDRSVFDMTLYAHHTILTSRCCPYQCRFCCSWSPGGKRGRVMSSHRILESLEWLVKKYGELTLYWGDEIFFWTREDRLSFCKLLKERQLPINFIVQLRADLIDSELIENLHSVGCKKICIGAEAGSDRLLSVANKHITAEQISSAIYACVSGGMPCKTWWMVGLPGGEFEDHLMALDIIEKTHPNEVAVHQFVPLPGSEFWNNAKKYGIHLPQISGFESLNYYSDPSKMLYDYISGQELYDILKKYETCLLKIGYIPTDQAKETDRYVFTTPFQHKTFNI